MRSAPLIMQTSLEPDVSIAMATCNGEPYIRKQIASILGQIRSTDQLVIVDDASDDGTWEYLRSLDHPAIELVRHSINQGIRKSFQAALRRCRNDIIFLSDQDDIWLQNKRDAAVRAFVANPDAAIVISDARLIDHADRVIGESFMQLRNGFKGGVWSTLLKNRYLGCAMVIQRRILAKALPISRFAPMHDMWLGALGAMQGRVIYIDEPLLHYRRHERNASPLTRRSILQMLRWRIAFAASILWRVLVRPIDSPPDA